jgi:hypothetical protein
MLEIALGHVAVGLKRVLYRLPTLQQDKKGV